MVRLVRVAVSCSDRTSVSSEYTQRLFDVRGEGRKMCQFRFYTDGFQGLEGSSRCMSVKIRTEMRSQAGDVDVLGAGSTFSM